MLLWTHMDGVTRSCRVAEMGVPKLKGSQTSLCSYQNLKGDSRPGQNLMPGPSQRKQQINRRASSGIRVIGKSKCIRERGQGPKGKPRLPDSQGYYSMVRASSEAQPPGAMAFTGPPWPASDRPMGTAGMGGSPFEEGIKPFCSTRAFH